MRWLYHLHRIYFPQIKVLANSFPFPFFNKKFPSFFFPPFSLFSLLCLFLFPSPPPPLFSPCLTVAFLSFSSSLLFFPSSPHLAPTQQILKSPVDFLRLVDRIKEWMNSKV